MFEFIKNIKKKKQMPEKKKALWIDETLHAEILALSDYKQMKIKDLVSNILRKAIREEKENG